MHLKRIEVPPSCGALAGLACRCSLSAQCSCCCVRRLGVADVPDSRRQCLQARLRRQRQRLPQIAHRARRRRFTTARCRHRHRTACHCHRTCAASAVGTGAHAHARARAHRTALARLYCRQRASTMIEANVDRASTAHVDDIEASAGQIQSGFGQSNLEIPIWRLAIQIWKVRLKSRFDHATQLARKPRERGGRAHAARPTQPTARYRPTF